ncbi:MAG TPA: protein-L-isoaspartate(D-aspartate) O-methyltransferase [Geminicoccaceae bacterium]|nr:protein-L-isoaspartate(D-aspartate) O-methyltransferase [Geminicoccaceae bacterium]
MRWRRTGPIALLALLLGVMGSPVGRAADDAAAARERMVYIVEREVAAFADQTGIAKIDPRVLDAMREVPRHAFVPEPLRPYAYLPQPLPVTPDQNIAAPMLVALMTHLVEVQPDDVVFETGTGAGYHAAVLSRLAAQVYSVEVIEPLADRAARLLKEFGYGNVEVQAGDGYYGWSEHAPYDAIVVKEAIDHLPQPLLNQLKRGGRLVIPLGPAAGPQYLTLVRRDEAGKLHQRRIMPVRFSPLQGGERL